MIHVHVRCRSARPVDLCRSNSVGTEADPAPGAQASDDSLSASIHLGLIDPQHLCDGVERLAVEQHGEDRKIVVVQAVTMLAAAVYVFLNLAADLATIMVTPRLRTAGR